MHHDLCKSDALYPRKYVSEKSWTSKYVDVWSIHTAYEIFVHRYIKWQPPAKDHGGTSIPCSSTFWISLIWMRDFSAGKSKKVSCIQQNWQSLWTTQQPKMIVFFLNEPVKIWTAQIRNLLCRLTKKKHHKDPGEQGPKPWLYCCS